MIEISVLKYLWAENPVHEAIKNNDVSALQILSVFGWDINAKGTDGKTPFEIAIASGNCDLIPNLLNLGVQGAFCLATPEKAREAKCNLLADWFEKTPGAKVYYIMGNSAVDMYCGKSKHATQEMLHHEKQAVVNRLYESGEIDLHLSAWGGYGVELSLDIINICDSSYENYETDICFSSIAASI